MTDFVKPSVIVFVDESNALNADGEPEDPPAAIVIVGKSLANERVTYTLFVRWYPYTCTFSGAQVLPRNVNVTVAVVAVAVLITALMPPPKIVILLRLPLAS